MQFHGHKSTRMKSIAYIPIATSFIFSILFGNAQQDETKAGRVSPKELSIPASPFFDLMGVTSSQVTRTSVIKDFKVDWSFKSWKLNPNLAIQSQPVWEMLYNRKTLTKYQNASSFMRRLSSLDISIGSVQNEDNDRRIGFAAKLNVFDQKDPLMAEEIYAGIDEKYKSEGDQWEAQLKELNKKLDTTTNVLEKPGLRSRISPLSYARIRHIGSCSQTCSQPQSADPPQAPRLTPVKNEPQRTQPCRKSHLQHG